MRYYSCVPSLSNSLSLSLPLSLSASLPLSLPLSLSLTHSLSLSPSLSLCGQSPETSRMADLGPCVHLSGIRFVCGSPRDPRTPQENTLENGLIGKSFPFICTVIFHFIYLYIFFHFFEFFIFKYFNRFVLQLLFSF